MQPTEKIWMDGKLVDWKDANVHILTHSLHYGSGVFEGIRCYKTQKGPAVFRLKEHIDRLFFSADVMGMKLIYSKDEISKAILETIRANKQQECYIRPLIYYGDGTMGLNPEKVPVKVSIAVWPWGAYLGDKPVSVKTSSKMRIDPRTTEVSAKICGHYTNSIMANLEAKKQGYDEALLLDYKGYVAEGSGENIFMVKKNKLITPALGTILPGITRAAIIKIAKDLGYEVEEKDFTLEELKNADEVFFTGTAAEVTSINKIDEKLYNTNQITKTIKDKFFEIIDKAEPEEWFAFV